MPFSTYFAFLGQTRGSPHHQATQTIRFELQERWKRAEPRADEVAFVGEDEDEVIVGAVVVAVVETGGNAPGQATAKAEVEAESTDPCGVARAMRVPLEAGAGQVEAPPEMKGTAPSIYRVKTYVCLFIFS
jgi:hypothetical protein